MLAALILLTALVDPARAQNGSGVEAGQSPSADGAASAGDEVFAGDGCARAGDASAGDCDEDSGKDKGKDGDAAGGNTKTPEEASNRPQNGGGGTEPGAGEDTSGATGTTGSSEPDENMDRTTVMGSTGPDLDETTQKALPGSEGTGTTASGEPAACPVAPPEDAQAATVARAVDGDTIELQEPVDGYDRVRLISVDTPEMGGEDGPPDAGAEEAKAFTAEVLEGKEVALETDEEVEDPYGRLLAYVWLPAEDKAQDKQREFFNRTLIAEGYAEPMTVEPNEAYAECLAAAEDKSKGDVPDTTGGDTTGESPRDGGDKDENEGFLNQLRNLISPEEASDEQPTGNEDQYDQDGTTGGPLPTGNVDEESFQEDTSKEDTAPDPVAGSTSQERTFPDDDLPPAAGEQYDRGEKQEPEEREPEIQEPEVQDDPVQDEPERSSEPGTDSDLTSPELADPAPEEFVPDELAAPQSPQPAETDTETDTETITKPETETEAGAEVADEAQITTLPDTSGVTLTQLAALPAGILLVCSGLLAALVRGPRETRRNESDR